MMLLNDDEMTQGTFKTTDEHETDYASPGSVEGNTEEGSSPKQKAYWLRDQ